MIDCKVSPTFAFNSVQLSKNIGAPFAALFIYIEAQYGLNNTFLSLILS